MNRSEFLRASSKLACASCLAFAFGSRAYAADAPAAVDPAQLAAARSLYEARKTSEAQQAFEKIAAADPQCADAHYFLAHLALGRDDAKAAVASAEKCVALAPDNADGQHTLGDAYGRSAQQAGVFSKFGYARKCLAAFQRAVALAPDRVEFHQSLFDY
jgi:tetratricopeptide (TPR) repeat protein